MQYDLWPKPKFSDNLKNAFSFNKITLIEDLLNDYFPGYFPILLPSARFAIFLCLLNKKISRKDNIFIFPYASHCIWDAVSRIGNPNILNAKLSKFKIDYHQWGFEKKMDPVNLLIEDSADTFYQKRSQLFSQNGQYEIWSLPKIIGSNIGGVLWCKNKTDYDSILKLRNNFKKSTINTILKITSIKYKYLKNYFEPSEYKYGIISSFSSGEIYNKIKEWDNIFNERQKRIKLLNKYIPKWAIFKNRLPSNIPFLANNKYLDKTYLSNIGIIQGVRMFDKNLVSLKRNFIPVVPLPVHHDVDIDWLKNLKQSNLLVNSENA